MLSFRVSLALRAKPLRHKLNFARTQTFRTTPTCNLNRINQLHTLENRRYATRAKSITSTLLKKQPGCTPQRPSRIFSQDRVRFSALHSVRNRKCHSASTSACTIADAKIDSVLRHV